MGRRKIREMPAKEEMADLHLTQGKRQSDMATHYGVSRDTVKDWLKFHGIEKNPERRPLSVGAKRPHSGRPASDPKRVSWLTADDESPVTVAVATLAPPPSGPRPLRKIADIPPGLQEPARQALQGFMAYVQRRRAAVVGQQVAVGEQDGTCVL